MRNSQILVEQKKTAKLMAKIIISLQECSLKRIFCQGSSSNMANMKKRIMVKKKKTDL